MGKRALAGLLWFVATMWMFNFASAFFGVPSYVGFLVAAAIGLFIVRDPLRFYWRGTRRTVAIAPVEEPEYLTSPQPSR